MATTYKVWLNTVGPQSLGTRWDPGVKPTKRLKKGALYCVFSQHIALTPQEI